MEIVNVSWQRTCTDKAEYTSPKEDVHSLHYVEAVATKDKGNVASVDLPENLMRIT